MAPDEDVAVQVKVLAERVAHLCRATERLESSVVASAEAASRMEVRYAESVAPALLQVQAMSKDVERARGGLAMVRWVGLAWGLLLSVASVLDRMGV